jgi:acid phosphatase
VTYRVRVHRLRIPALLAALALIITACTSSGPATAAATAASTAPTTSSTSTRPTHKMLVILLENHSQTQALAQMPHLAAWARRYGQATDYHAITHPSLPNYLAIWGGSTFGVTSDCTVGAPGCTASPPSVFGQTIAAGHTARAYQESMSTSCQQTTAGSYAPRHSPWPYWSAERRMCLAQDVPSGTPSAGPLRRDIVTGRLPTTGELTPNVCNDGHDCPLSTADAWLSTWVRELVAGPDYRTGRLTIVITFDEDDFQPANRVAFVVIDPRLHGRTVTGPFNHYSLTRWLCANAGVPLLRNAAYARPLRAAFGL